MGKVKDIICKLLSGLVRRSDRRSLSSSFLISVLLFSTTGYLAHSYEHQRHDKVSIEVEHTTCSICVLFSHVFNGFAPASNCQTDLILVVDDQLAVVDRVIPTTANFTKKQERGPPAIS